MKAKGGLVKKGTPIPIIAPEGYVIPRSLARKLDEVKLRR